MAPEGKKNPIERRLEDLESQWNEFAEDSEARVFVWVIEPDERRMIDVFLSVQEEEGSSVPDLFVRFDTPFETAADYGGALVDSLLEQYEESSEVMEEGGVDSSWQPPETKKSEPGIKWLVRCCDSFCAHYDEILERMVLVLNPLAVTSFDHMRRWIEALLTLELPDKLRIMLVDDTQAPQWAGLVEDQPDLVKSEAAEMNMAGAMQELAQETPGREPGNLFRRHLVAMNNSAAEGDMKGAEKSGRRAMRIARENKWLQMQIVVHMALGSAYLAAQRFDEAINSYRRAGRTSEKAIREEDPAGEKLLLQARLSAGAAFVGDSRFDEAARVYEHSAPLAEKLEDKTMTLECWRMASFCYEQSKNMEQAWECGEKALDASEAMEPDERKTSTLPYAAQGMLRIAEEEGPHERSDQVHQRMHELVGPDWEQLLEQGDTAP
jgi:tetratricopeptide (TPR) repeat protein